MMKSTDNMFFDRFRLLSKLGQGSFGRIFKGIDTVENKLVAIKVETRKGDGQLKLEARIYKEMEGTVINKNIRWPRLHNFGCDPNGNNIMIMDLLGPNIDNILRKTAKNKLSDPSVAYLADKMISLVESFHNNGIVHRDLKPQNFVLEYCEHSYPKFPEIFLIDYGLARHYIKPDRKTHIEFCQKKSLKGTVRYSSINTHLGIDQSRRDDMQSLGYIFLYMSVGKLPWQNLMKDRSKNEGYHHIMTIKMNTPVEKLCETLNEPMKIAMMSFLFYVNSLMYHEKPDYDYCRNLFYDLSSLFTGNLFKGAM